MEAIVILTELDVAFDVHVYSKKIFANKPTVLEILVTGLCGYLYVKCSNSFIFGDLLAHGHLLFIIRSNLNFCIERTIYYL